MKKSELIELLKEISNDAVSSRDYSADAADYVSDILDSLDDAKSASDNAHDYAINVLDGLDRLISDLEKDADDEGNIKQFSNTQLAEELAARIDRLPATDDEATNTVIRSVKLSLNGIIQLMKQFKLG